MRPRSLFLVCFSALALLWAAIAPPSSAAAVGDTDRAAATRAVDWLATQQQDDGGFEVAQFPGFETPEALLSFAAAAMGGQPWSGRIALHAAQTTANADGRTGLDYLDDYAEATGDDAISGGVAAKLLTLIAGPLCLDARRFDPQGDRAVDLIALMDGAARDNGAFGPDGVFSDTLWAVLAHTTIGRATPAKTIAYIESAQESDGGWNYAGSPDDQGFDDIDTTALAIQALVTAGVPATEPSLAKAIDYLRGLQGDDGSWSFGDPNSTAVALLALESAGVTPDGDARAFLRSQQRSDGRIESPNDSFSVNTYATTQSVRALLGRTLPIVPAAGTCAGEGYELFGADGGVFTYGKTAFHGSAGGMRLNSPIVGGASAATGRGYYLFGGDGGVFGYGDAAFFGAAASLPLRSPIVGGAPTPTGRGYLLFAADGGVFAYGDAVFAGSMGGRPINSPVVGGAITPTGRGYLLFAADGGVFRFGDAVFAGSMGGSPLNKPVVAGAITPTGRGYLLFAADGGAFRFGDADFLGSLGGRPLNQPIVGASMSALGHGYALFAADGGVFAFGDVVFAGSAGSLTLNSPVIAGSLD